MASPLPVRGIDGHLIWGADGTVWACFEVEPFPYPHRSVRDAREIHARTVGALLCLPGQSLILSIARSLSRDELEQRIRGSVDPVAGTRLGRRGAFVPRVGSCQSPCMSGSGSWRSDCPPPTAAGG